MTLYSRRTLLVSFLGALAGACSAHAPMVPLAIVPPALAPPIPVPRPVDHALEACGAMVRAYTAVDEHDLVVAIDVIPNDSGLEKELPSDLGIYAGSVFDVIGKPFVTFRTLPGGGLLKTPASLALSARQEGPAPPPLDFRLVGALERASEIGVDDRNRHIDIMGGSDNHSFEGGAQRGRRVSVTSLTLKLNLETPNHLAVRGTDATYRIYVDKFEHNRSISLYVAGSGGGKDTKLTVTQELGDALYDATAAALLHALGHALLIPYYRCHALFPPDPALDARVQDAFSRLTRAQLEQHVKRFFFLRGFPVDLHTPGLTVDERAAVAVEMQHRGLDFADRRALINFSFQLWQQLDYVQAATRLEARLTESAQAGAEAEEQRRANEARRKAADTQRHAEEEKEKKRQAELVATPAEFGWPATARVVVVDWSQVPPSARARILALLRSCPGTRDIKVHPTKPLLGIRTTASRATLERVLRQPRLSLAPVWTDLPQLRLRLTPR